MIADIVEERQEQLTTILALLLLFVYCLDAANLLVGVLILLSRPRLLSR